jgi:molybdenum cofactor biosynthesis enzyme MoaA
MSVNREELKRLIDFIHEEDAAEVYDFIGYLNMKREREAIDQMNLDHFSEDKELIRQVQKSRDDRTNGRIYDQEQGLKYLQNKIKEFESEQNL